VTTFTLSCLFPLEAGYYVIQTGRELAVLAQSGSPSFHLSLQSAGIIACHHSWLHLSFLEAEFPGLTF
jgi:hypothetical protein